MNGNNDSSLPVWKGTLTIPHCALAFPSCGQGEARGRYVLFIPNIPETKLNGTITDYRTKPGQHHTTPPAKPPSVKLTANNVILFVKSLLLPAESWISICTLAK